MMRVLIADQDQQFAAQRADQLLIDGHEPVIALSARALGLKLAELPDTQLLGDLGGTSTTIALLRQLRAGACRQADNTVPVLVIGADSDTDSIRYYRAGADALLPSDCSPLLIAAVEALGRRTAAPGPRLLKIADLVLDLDARTGRVEDRELTLTRLEYHLLQRSPASPARHSTAHSSPATCGATTPPPPAPVARSTRPRTGCARNSSRPAPSR